MNRIVCGECGKVTVTDLDEVACGGCGATAWSCTSHWHCDPTLVAHNCPLDTNRAEACTECGQEPA